MIIKRVEEYKLSTTKQAITSFAGLPLLMGMAKALGLEEKINALPLKERERGYKPAESAFALMGMLYSGGEALSDVALLRADEGMKEMFGDIPAANTLGEWLRRFWWKTVYLLGTMVLETGVQVIRLCGLKSVTLDIDSFFLDSQKSGVVMNFSESACQPGLKGR